VALNKKQLGQFFTKNTDYILSGLEGYIKGKQVTDPFAGAGDLLDWAERHGAASTAGFDVDRQWVDGTRIRYHDSLQSPGEYRFVLTNPPYLYQNKMEDNSLLLNSKHTDLYQLSLERVMASEEGIVIVPVNLLSSENARYIRELFFSRFVMVRCNYFTEQVFSDTTYTIIAFYYARRESRVNQNEMEFELVIYPEGRKTAIRIYKAFNWQIGGEFLDKVRRYGNRLSITRLEEEDLKPGAYVIRAAYTNLAIPATYQVDRRVFERIKKNIVVLKAIDTGSAVGRIGLEDIRRYQLDALVSSKTSRHQIFLLFPEYISIDEQEEIITLFNREIEEKRREYFSLFMTNFRDHGRKRISFHAAYCLINYLYFAKIQGGEARVRGGGVRKACGE